MLTTNFTFFFSLHFPLPRFTRKFQEKKGEGKKGRKDLVFSKLTNLAGVFHFYPRGFSIIFVREKNIVMLVWLLVDRNLPLRTRMLYFVTILLCFYYELTDICGFECTTGNSLSLPRGRLLRFSLL